ncbi:MAG: LexA family transcriptional regulator [Sphingobium sp.]|nr:MAG: LexA family transcriptional regulator [Sphingobium sp.]
MLVPDRLISRMATVSETQSSLARLVGVSPQAIGKLVRGESASSPNLHLIAQHLKTTVSYLTGQTDDPDEGAFIPPTTEEIAEQMGLIRIEEIDLALGMGSAYSEDAPVHATAQWMPENWVRQFTNAPATFLTIARPRGDSMYPTINDRDIVIIDRSRRSIDEQEAIWALFYGGLGMIKRVRAMPDGNYKLMADNQQVSDEMAVDGEMSVFGRVVGVIRRT